MEPRQVTEPPFITPDLKGIGGRIKADPEHFKVEEIPLYPACGQGPHLYLTLERTGMNTRDLVSGLAELFGLAEGDIGYAGLKDKHSVATQTFSLGLQDMEPDQAAKRAEMMLPVKAVAASRHTNKLKTGHLLGNRFRILVSDPEPGALELAQEVAARLEQTGLPNFFGAQRFGRGAENLVLGRKALKGRGPRQKWLRKLVLSAYQSELFNRWLALRMERGDFGLMLNGDVAKKTDTGGLFVVEDPEAEQKRFDDGEIVYTGPIYGSKMRAAEDRAGELEQAVLEEDGLDKQTLAKAKLKGTRRRAVLRLEGLTITPEERGIRFGFALPKGSFATVLLREFRKTPFLEQARPE